MNEPSGATSDVVNEEVATYNAIRGTGNDNMVLLDEAGGYTTSGFPASNYSAMTNVAWDTHFYGWVSGYSTDIPTIQSALANQISATANITDANGTLPTVIGEYGDSTAGNSTDANGTQVVQVVGASGYPSMAWNWASGAGADNLTDGNGNLTSLGQQVAAIIAAHPASAPSTPSAPPSANDTVVKAGSGGSITDASGDNYIVTGGGQIAVNGVTDTTTANVVELAFISGKVWQENGSNTWYGETSPSAGWSAGTSTSPVPAKPTASANDTVVKAGSTAAITDAAGAKWTITGGSQLALNGVADTSTANVTELAYVNGKIWQENSSNLWYGETSPSAGWSAGTSTSPLPAPPAKPTASANDTVVKAGSTAAITDAAGAKWTITGGSQVALNGVADTSTANVTELAYVKGAIWQENKSDLWSRAFQRTVRSGAVAGVLAS